MFVHCNSHAHPHTYIHSYETYRSTFLFGKQIKERKPKSLKFYTISIETVLIVRHLVAVFGCSSVFAFEPKVSRVVDETSSTNQNTKRKPHVYIIYIYTHAVLAKCSPATLNGNQFTIHALKSLFGQWYHYVE